jgi:hypothetical protein
MSAFVIRVEAVLAADPTFDDASGFIRRMSWPRRWHENPERTLVISPGNPAPGRVGSQGEDEWSWPIDIGCGLVLQEDDQGRVIAIVGDWAQQLLRLFRAKPSPLETAILPTGSSHLRTLVRSMAINQAPTTSGPKSHRITVRVEPHTCEQRS